MHEVTVQSSDPVNTIPEALPRVLVVPTAYLSSVVVVQETLF